MIKNKVFYGAAKLFSQKKQQRVFFGKKDEFTRKVHDDDIHGARMAEALFEDQNQESAPVFKFEFKDSGYTQLDLRDINRVDFDNSEKINIVPTLIEPLDVIVNNPGIYPISSFEYHKNYEHLLRIPTDSKIELFDTYVPPSQDDTLKEFAEKLNLRYIVSTSTFSSFLSQIFYILSGFKSPVFNTIFQEFPDEPRKYMISQRKPTSSLLHKMGDDLHALDSDPGIFEQEIFALMNSGKIIERQLTQERDEFNKRYVNLDSEVEPIPDFHRFMKLNNELCLRSQIDCRSKGENPIVYEIKARSVCPIRYDYPNYADYMDYVINKYKGNYCSYEREYYDLIRGAFLKWAFQLMIGRMDGAFVAYHNLNEIQGFEYIKASEIYQRIFGTQAFSEAVLLVGSKLSTKIFDEIRASINEDYKTLKIGVYAQNFTKKLVIFVEILKDSKETIKVMRSEGLVDEYDYYLKHPLTNRVLKYECLVQPEINGIPYQYPVQFKKGDHLGLKYKFRCLGEPEFGDYMNFLHDCYKHEEVNVDLNYAGAWLKYI